MTDSSPPAGMIDWHCHILPGLDDGAATVEEALEMAAILSAVGFSHIHCTPHQIKGCFDADNRAVTASVVALQAAIRRAGLSLTLLPGREYSLDEFFPGYLRDPMPLGATNYLLLEVPGQVEAGLVKETCRRIVTAGYVPLIAHPERSPLFSLPAQKTRGVLSSLQGLFSSSPTEKEGNRLLVDYLRGLGCGFQGNASSFTGMYGPRAGRRAVRLREEGVYTCFGTDAHAAGQLRHYFARDALAIGGERLRPAALFSTATKGCPAETGGAEGERPLHGA